MKFHVGKRKLALIGYLTSFSSNTMTLMTNMSFLSKDILTNHEVDIR